MDLWSVPVRLDSEPVQVIRRDAAVWETAWWRPPFTTDVDNYGEPLPEVNQAMLADRPSALDTLEGPWHSGARGYERAEYALDPAAYRRLDGHEERERSLPYRIIHGDRHFADHTADGQGMPWRCSTRVFLVEAADAIEALDEAVVRREFSIQEMVGLGVYKTRPDDDEDETFARAMDDLRWLARYYRDVAAHGHDLIVIQD
ncbi:DUF1877 family protein [Spirillospora sp. NPDC052269]